MKANELMIGNWVMVRRPSNRLEKVRVKSVIGNGTIEAKTRDGLVVFGESAVEPIPLTKDVLEKNGFTCDANGMNDSDEPVVSVEYGEFQRNTDDGFEMLADGKAIKYVHELQQALRLCGIEKEITI